EVGSVEMAPVGRLPDEQRDLDALCEPLVRGHVELAHRLLVPEVFRLAQRTAEVDGVGEVEGRGTVVHELDVRPHVRTHALAQLGVSPCVAPGVQLDRRVAELEALVTHLEELLDRRERRRRGVRGNRVPVRPQQTMHRDAEATRLEVPEGDVDDAEQPDRELLGPVELPQPVPEKLAAVGTLPTSSSRKIRSTMSPSM